MSFRSRSRNIQPIMTRRRSLSNSRVPTSTPTSIYSSPSSSISSTRPLSTAFYSSNPSSYGGGYQSVYANQYGSRESIYNPSARSSSIYAPSGNNLRRDSYGGSSNGLNTFMLNGGSTMDKRYTPSTTSSYTSPYADRYVSPYCSYDKGITTAGLSLSLSGNGAGGSGSTSNGYSSKNSSSLYTPSKLSSSTAGGAHKQRDYTPARNSSFTSKSLSASNNSISSYSSPTTPASASSTAQQAVLLGRSQSLRDQERKSRSRSRKGNAQARSLSVSSEKSEGYESGSERTSRSRLGSTSSAAEHVDLLKEGADSSENGELIDYKALYEAAKADNEKLKIELKKKDEDLLNAKATVDRFANATTKNTLSELEKRERRAMERKVSEMEEELKQLDALRTENQRLKDENGALIRVISKLSK